MSKIYTILVYRFFLILALSIGINLQANSIHLPLKMAPFSVQQDVGQQIAAGKDLPLPKLSGFIALYGGFVSYSGRDGSIEFPVLQKDPKLYLVITPEIDLVTVYGKTVSHSNFAKGVDAKIYLFERKQNAAKNVLYWQVSEVPKPADNRISPISIILLTNPKNIVVPKGDFIAQKNANLVLPEIYVVGDTNNTKTALDFLDIKHFFEPIEQEEKEEKKVTKTLITNK